MLATSSGREILLTTYRGVESITVATLVPGFDRVEAHMWRIWTTVPQQVTQS